MTNKKTLIIILSVFFFSCWNNKYGKYTETPSGLKYRLISFGNESKKTEIGDYISCKILIISQNRDTIFEGDSVLSFQLENKIGGNEIFSLLSQGDSASFITNSGQFRNNSTGINLNIPANDVPLMINVKILRISSVSAFKAEQKLLGKDPELQEQIILKEFLKSNNIDSQYYRQGVYVLLEQTGKGRDSIVKGSIVNLQYRGYFLDGKEFDNTKHSEKGLQINYGREGQIIKGLEIAIKGMKIGEKAKIIIPSQLAFGSKGSINNIVPPFTTVIYEIKILKIKNDET